MTVAREGEPLSFEDLDDVVDALRAAGHRVSMPARLVLETLFAADGPVSAERIADGLGARTHSLELTSVYRNLERLEALGVVSHLHAGHGAGLYALARGHDREYLVCERCGRVTSLEPAALDAIRDEIRGRLDFNPRFTHFPIHGHCGDCERSFASGSESRLPPGKIERDGGHEHEHRHGDRVHSHPHLHEAGHEHDHEHRQ